MGCSRLCLFLTVKQNRSKMSQNQESSSTPMDVETAPPAHLFKSFMSTANPSVSYVQLVDDSIQMEERTDGRRLASDCIRKYLLHDGVEAIEVIDQNRYLLRTSESLEFELRKSDIYFSTYYAFYLGNL